MVLNLLQYIQILRLSRPAVEVLRCGMDGWGYDAFARPAGKVRTRDLSVPRREGSWDVVISFSGSTWALASQRAPYPQPKMKKEKKKKTSMAILTTTWLRIAAQAERYCWDCD